jgi:SAM-dependent methyltransferase
LAQVKAAEMTLISVYIPETAGATFGELLKVHFGDRICLHYYHPNRYDAFTSSLVRIESIPTDVECLHGHFLARRFLDQYQGAKLVTWLRDPVERVVSEYERLKANPDPQSGLSQLIAAGASLLDFAENEYARDTQARYLDGVPLDQFAFVGVSERFVKELARFAGLTGIRLFAEDHINAGARWRRSYAIDEATGKHIRELNQADCALYKATDETRLEDLSPGPRAEANPPSSGGPLASGPSSPESSYFDLYPAHIARLQETISGDAAMEAAVGGEFLTIGKLELALLRSLGLKGGDTVVDVGCGSGRLAWPLSAVADVSYVGTDIVPQLLEHAKKIAGRDDWRFELTQGLTIPCGNNSADFICFFSVLTHLTHEDSYRYLREARRVLKRGGKIVFSFLEFYKRFHWITFQRGIDNKAPGDPLNQFIERDAILAWASHLELKVCSFHDGDKPHIPIEGDLKWENGIVMTKMGNLGQSVAILEKP